MNVTFKSANGFCPCFIYNGIKFYLFEEENMFGEMSWVLKSQHIGFLEKVSKSNPYSLLDRFFKNKKYALTISGNYKFYYWRGKQIATDGIKITIQYQRKYERPYFDTYADCLADAKKYITEKYLDEQITLYEEVKRNEIKK